MYHSRTYRKQAPRRKLENWDTGVVRLKRGQVRVPMYATLRAATLEATQINSLERASQQRTASYEYWKHCFGPRAKRQYKNHEGHTLVLQTNIYRKKNCCRSLVEAERGTGPVCVTSCPVEGGPIEGVAGNRRPANTTRASRSTYRSITSRAQQKLFLLHRSVSARTAAASSAEVVCQQRTC